MPTINATMLKGQIWNYIDGEKIKGLIGKAGDANYNPFRLGPDGKPIGIQNAVMENAGMFMELIQAGAYAVEKVCHDAGAVSAGGEKKKALVDWLNSIIDIPWVPEGLEDNIIEFVIDKVIAWLNMIFGKDWITKFIGPTIVKVA